MNKIKICKNKCIFCFIEQLPKGLRPTLYVKDDDYLESYTHGNFITLTNLNRKDISNIIRFKIEPLHVSLHSFNINIRNVLFGNTKNSQALRNLKILDENSIRTNIQIVLCPGINDGEDLRDALDILINSFNKILSIGIVPVGLTKYNNCNFLRSFNAVEGKAVISFIEEYRHENKKNKNSIKIYLSDEFYLIAKKEFPPYREYGKFLQIKNGIGKTADFLEEFSKSLLKYESDIKINRLLSSHALIVTSEYGKDVFDFVFKRIQDFTAGFYGKKISECKIREILNILTVKNSFLGGNVKVTGLLSGNDIIEQLKSVNLGFYKKVIIPDCIFNSDGFTIDNCSRDEIINHGNGNIVLTREDGKSLAHELMVI